MLYKFAVKTYLISMLSLIFALLMVIYVSDPYMLFHKHWFHHNKINYNMRIQDYGLVKYGKFDGIILGTSMLENTSAAEAGSKLNVNFANLSISGSSYFERFKVLNTALKSRPFKHVIFSLDYTFSLYHTTNETFDPALYSGNSIIGKINIYSTDKALRCIFLNKKCDFTNYNLDRPKAWYNNNFHARRFGGFENWLKYAKEDHQIKDAFEQLRAMDTDYTANAKFYKQIIDEEVLPLLKYPNTTFSVIIPPYSALYWAKRKNFLPALLKPYQYLLEKTAQMPNVKIYWFYDEDYIFDITQYKDLTHYHYAINSLQLDAIKNGTHILTLDNCKEKFENFIQKINDFDLQFYIDQIPND